ncbi:hypothetical protein [Halolamina salifodinae]|uniref:Uncharacterized protein n=1 Tax=Halolamina salifodinae TaxID=1202767 RepID=A0A8T4GS33_9EURY|nr:hypothetical protein [Halolamina salifodinae]MBP1985951.1 hypothetical protein [Halolamina salifodinae]
MAGMSGGGTGPNQMEEIFDNHRGEMDEILEEHREEMASLQRRMTYLTVAVSVFTAAVTTWVLVTV